MQRAQRRAVPSGMCSEPWRCAGPKVTHAISSPDLISAARAELSPLKPWVQVSSRNMWLSQHCWALKFQLRSPEITARKQSFSRESLAPAAPSAGAGRVPFWLFRSASLKPARTAPALPSFGSGLTLPCAPDIRCWTQLLSEQLWHGSHQMKCSSLLQGRSWWGAPGPR